MTTRLTVLEAGLATLQDLGRAGHAHLGVATGGAADRHAAVVANTLVANGPGAPLVEVTASAFALRAGSDVLLAVTGAAEPVLVDGIEQRAWEPLVVAAGQQVVVPAPRVGLRSYLAVSGVIDAAVVLGSVAPDPLLGVGTWLAPGDELAVDTRFETVRQPWLELPLFRLGAAPTAPRRPLVVDVTPGPELDQVSGGGACVLSAPFTVDARSNHVGLRLDGPVPERTTQAEILSRGVPVGAVEVPPGGGALVLLRGRLITAGYPVVAVATTLAVDALGQAAAGDDLTFRLVDVADAHGALRRRDDELRALAHRTATVLAALSLGHLLAPDHLSRVL